MNWSEMSNRPLRIIMVAGILIFINIIGAYFYKSIDLTEDQRYVLTDATKKQLQKVNDIIYVRVLLEGEFPSGFKRLQSATKDILDQFRSENSNIDYIFENPNEGSLDIVNQRREDMSKDGIIPTNLMIRSGSENKEQLIYPYAILKYGEKKIVVNLLENIAGFDQETNLANSIGLLEYKLANGLQKLMNPSKKNLLLVTGHGELPEELTKSFEALERPFFNIGRINLDSVYSIKKEADVVIIARPVTAFSEKQKFMLDQYIMNGGKVIWMIDGLKITIDSLMTRNEFIPEPLDVNLGDMLFKYGVRINPTLVLDLECSRIPQVIGKQGDKPQIELFPWYYHPLVAPSSDNPIVKDIDRINMEFASTIDSLKTKYDIKKTAIIQSSQYSRYQMTPMTVGFDILRYKPDPSKFDKPNLPMGFLLEGKFSSLYENRVESNMLESLKNIGMEFKESSSENKMIIIADGDIIKSLYDKDNGKFAPLGYNKYEKTTFNGNKEFISNALDYMVNEDNVLSARSKEVKIRILNRVEAEEHKSFWQFLNIGLPLLGLLGFSFLNAFWRRKKYVK